MLKQMLFLPARDDPNNLLHGSFCVGTKQPLSVHNNVCKQPLPLISTAMLPKHTFPQLQLILRAVAKHCLIQFAAHGIEVRPQGLLCACQPGQWEFSSQLGPVPCSLDPTHVNMQWGPLFTSSRGHLKAAEPGWPHPPQVPWSARRAGEDTWVIVSFGLQV